MLRTFPVLLASLVAASPATAQILYAKPKDERVEKRYDKYLTAYQGMRVIIGEPKQGIQCQPGVVTRTGGSEAKNEMYVADPSDPTFVPYKWEDGRRVKNGKRSVVQFSGDDFPVVNYVDALQTLHGLANEYGGRMGEIDSLRARRDGAEKGSNEWFGPHGMMLARLDRLRNWLVNMGYPAAAKKLERTIDKEKSQVSKEASAAREKTAMSSIKKGDVPPKLIEASQSITGGRAKFNVIESRHLRIIYCTDLSDVSAENGIRLGEEVVEAFRKDFVDPYRDDAFRDYIPDGRFLEFFFGPDDDVAYEKFREEFYGVSWDSGRRAEQIKMGGSRFRTRRQDADYYSYWRLKEQRDIDGIITHTLGHVLVNLHCARGVENSRQDWMEEAAGYYVSFGHLGRNAVTCFTWHVPSYAKPAAEEGEKTVQEGLRGYFNELALSKGPTIDALVVKTLADLTDADFAKAWSFFDYMALELGKPGQYWLRNACAAAQSEKKSDFIRRLRAYSEELFPVEPGRDVFTLMDDKWRGYAEGRQRKD